MIPNPWVLLGAILGGILLACGLAYGGYTWGVDATEAKYLNKALTQADKVLVRERIIEREVPKIVTKTVTKTVTVEKEVERVVTQIEHDIPVDCVLPDNYGVLLVAAANGLDPSAPGVADALTGAYGCREVLEATLKDLKAGYINTATLEGLEEYVRIVTNPERKPQ